MGLSSRAGKFLQKLAKDKDSYVRKEAEFAGKSVEVGGMKKKELEKMASKGGDDKILAKGEIERRAKNKEVRKNLKEQVKSGEISEKSAKNKYEYRRQKPVSGDDARDSAAQARDEVYDPNYYDDDFAKGGLVKKKPTTAKAKAPAAKKATAATAAPAAKSRTNALNKYYGK
jgi:hypothetical protein